MSFFRFQTKRNDKKIGESKEIIYQSSSRDASDRIGVWGSVVVGESIDRCWFDNNRRRDFFPLVEDDEDIDNNPSRSERSLSIAKWMNK